MTRHPPPYVVLLMASLFDPEDLAKSLLRFSAPEELTARLAARQVCRRCRVDPGWRRRTDALIAELAPTTELLARFLEQANERARVLEKHADGRQLETTEFSGSPRL